MVKNYQELYALIDYLKKSKKKFLIIGNGSKLVFKRNYRGIIIDIKELNKIEINNDICEVEAGTLLVKLINKLKVNNLGGIEELVGIPASIGGGLHNNISAHNVCLSDYLLKVIVFKNGEIKVLKKEDIVFKYRYSSLQQEGIILKAIFRFYKKEIYDIDNNINKYLEYRKIHQETKYPNIGSIFKNNKISAVQIIKDCHLENYKYKNVSFSKKHLNFLKIEGKVKGKYIFKFVKNVQRKVKRLKNIDIKTEIVFK
jgi:UDP-N-acetylmuramate dehydrogenase